MRLAFLGMLCLVLMACNSETAVTVPTLFIPTTPTLTFTPSSTPSATLSPTPSPSQTFTPSQTEVRPPSYTPSATFSPTPSQTPLPNITPSATRPQARPEIATFGELSRQIDRAGMIQSIQTLVNFGNRYSNSAVGDGTRGVFAARDYLKGRLEAQANVCANPALFYEDPFSLTFEGSTTTQSNLILSLTGTRPDLPAYLIGAHYDTDSKLARSHRNFALQPGADDNGSGVATVLELARLLCLEPRAGNFIFVLFAAEEVSSDGVGRSGSRHFVRNFLPRQSWRIAGMLNLDTIGSATDERGAIVDKMARLYSTSPNDSPSRQLARRVQAAAFAQMPDFQLVIEDREDRERRWGDHMSFSRANYPAVRLLEGAEDTDRQDLPQDALNDIDPAYLVKNLQVVLAFLLGESEGASPPQNLNPRDNFLFWEAVPDTLGYVLAYRQPNETGYQFMEIPFDQSAAELPRNVLAAVGTIGANGLLGPLSREIYISP